MAKYIFFFTFLLQLPLSANVSLKAGYSYPIINYGKTEFNPDINAFSLSFENAFAKLKLINEFGLRLIYIPELKVSGMPFNDSLGLPKILDASLSKKTISGYVLIKKSIVKMPSSSLYLSFGGSAFYDIIDKIVLEDDALLHYNKNIGISYLLGSNLRFEITRDTAFDLEIVFESCFDPSEFLEYQFHFNMGIIL